MPWHRTIWAGWLLRLAGALLAAIGYRSGQRLFGVPVHPAGGLDYLLALVTFTAFSAGAALLVHGAHLFDPTDVPNR